MKKRGDVLLIIGIVILFLLISIIGAGFYFYNFYVFKTVRICVGDATDTLIPCNVTQDCINYATTSGLEIDLSDAPIFIQDNFQKILNEVVYCDKSCFVRSVRGFDYETQKIKMLDSCKVGEVELVAEIRGKDAWEIWKWTGDGRK